MAANFDLFIIGGGINGCGIARDAAGRGLRVGLAEMGDLASATSSASTKLFHGGLRYLEYLEFRLVRESLIEREVLLSICPHISRPMRFVLPLSPEMRFESTSPVSKMLAILMPWTKGRRPVAMIRAGLFLYDWMGGRRLLPGTRRLKLDREPEGRPLDARFKRAFEYSDGWVDDARLVALNARDAAEKGATIMTRTKVIAARRVGDLWEIATQGPEGETTHTARVLVNAAGPWAGQVVEDVACIPTQDRLRLVRGSHIVTRRLFAHDKAYFFQGSDGRIVFAIPYEEDFTLIGTTDQDHPAPDTKPECSAAEIDYLIGFVNGYFAKDISREDVVWTYSGVRPLHEDGEASATAASRDYTLRLDRQGPTLLNVFGGKITTYRKLAEAALERLSPDFADLPRDWTRHAPLPGGDFPVGGAFAIAAELRLAYPFLTIPWSQRLARAYGTDAAVILGQAKESADLGPDFGGGLTGAEVRWLMDREFARTAEDVLWRRTKLGLTLDAGQAARLDAWMAARV
jgi:glycerol-3-phosphate dehydrogenase